MTASGAQLKSNQSASKEDPSTIEEVMPQALVTMMPLGVKHIIYNYIDPLDKDHKDGYLWLEKSATPYKFLGISSLQKQILTLAEYAGPLNLIEAYIEKARARQEPHLPVTLIQAIKSAIIGLDQTMRDDKNNKLGEGMAERLLPIYRKIIKEKDEKDQKYLKELLVKEIFPLIEEGMSKDREDEKARRETNLSKVNEVFNAFAQNDEKAISSAISEFNEFVKSLKPSIITNNQYYLNLLDLVFVATDVLARRHNELTRHDCALGNYLGALADRFCYKIIGAAIQSNLPPRLRQILESGVSLLLFKNKKPSRKLDVAGAIFYGHTDYSLLVLGRDCYYGSTGRFQFTFKSINPACYSLPFQTLLNAIRSAYMPYIHSLLDIATMPYEKSSIAPTNVSPTLTRRKI